jgi:hypothetical protein
MDYIKPHQGLHEIYFIHGWTQIESTIEKKQLLEESQKMAFFIVTAVKTSNLTNNFFFKMFSLHGINDVCLKM